MVFAGCKGLPFYPLRSGPIAISDSFAAQDRNRRSSSLGRNERGSPTAFARRDSPSLPILVGLSGCALVVEQTHALGPAFSADFAGGNRQCTGHALRSAVLVSAKRDLPNDALGNLGD